MADETPFPDLITRVRGGDSAAAAELVRRYEPAIRRVVRLRLTDQRLRRAFDSMDVCQSVLGSFFGAALIPPLAMGWGSSISAGTDSFWWRMSMEVVLR